MVVGDRAPAHQRRNDRDAHQLGEFHEQVRGIGVDDAAARYNQRPLRLCEHIERLGDLRAAGPRPVHRERLISFRIELDFCHLHVKRQIDQHWTGAPRAHDVKRLLENPRDQPRFAHGDGPFGHRLGDALDVDSLEVLLVEAGPRRLARDAEDRDAVRPGGVKAGDHVGAGRAGCPDADADIAAARAGITLGHMGGALDVAGQYVADRIVGPDRGVERVDRRSRHAERHFYPFAFQYMHSRFHCSHPSHLCLLVPIPRRHSHRYRALA